MKRGCWLLALLVWLVALVGCTPRGGPAAGGGAAPGGQAVAASPAAGLPEGCGQFPAGPESTAGLSPIQVLCRFADGQGREVQLTAGRSSRGRQGGEFGWAHLRDKHLYGLWEAGGPNTRFEVVQARTEADVLHLLVRTLREGRPQVEANGRRTYRLPVAGTGHVVLVVVGESGRVITAYPEPERRR